MRSFSNHPNQDLVRRLHALPVARVDDVDPTRLHPSGAWSIDRANVFVPFKRLYGRGLQLSIGTLGDSSEKRFLERGKEFVFDESTQRVALLGDETVDHSKSYLTAWGVSMDEDGSTFQFPGPIDPAAVKVLINDTLIGAGTGYVIDHATNTVTITAAGFEAGRDPNDPAAMPAFKLIVGEWSC